MGSNSMTVALLAEVDWVHRLARSLLRDADGAADLAQDALTTAIEKGPEAGTSRQHLRAYLKGIVRRLALRNRRVAAERRWREQRVARAEASYAERDALTRLDLHQRLSVAVMSLAEPYRSTVVMRFFDGLSSQQIARRKGIRAQTVRQHLSRALAELRRRLDSEFGSRGA